LISQNSVTVPNAYSITGFFQHYMIWNLRLNLCVQALLKTSCGPGTVIETTGKLSNFDLAGSS